MQQIEKIDQYYRVGGKIYQFYISDIEMEDILTKKLPPEFSPFDMIVSRWDENVEFTHSIQSVNEFSELRNSGTDRFYLRSHKITPSLTIPTSSITTTAKNLYVKYYLYNGLIDLQHGFLLNNKSWNGSSIGLIDKCFEKSDPKNVIENKEAAALFQKIKKQIKTKLKFKSTLTLMDGKEIIARSPNVSSGFAELLNNGSISSTITIA